MASCCTMRQIEYFVAVGELGSIALAAEVKTLPVRAQALHGVAAEISGELRGALTTGSLVTLAPVVLPKLSRRCIQWPRCIISQPIRRR